MAFKREADVFGSFHPTRVAVENRFRTGAWHHKLPSRNNNMYVKRLNLGAFFHPFNFDQHARLDRFTSRLRSPREIARYCIEHNWLQN